MEDSYSAADSSSYSIVCTEKLANKIAGSFLQDNIQKKPFRLVIWGGPGNNIPMYSTSYKKQETCLLAKDMIEEFIIRMRELKKQE